MLDHCAVSGIGAIPDHDATFAGGGTQTDFRFEFGSAGGYPVGTCACGAPACDKLAGGFDIEGAEHGARGGTLPLVHGEPGVRRFLKAQGLVYALGLLGHGLYKGFGIEGGVFDAGVGHGRNKAHHTDTGENAHDGYNHQYFD